MEDIVNVQNVSLKYQSPNGEIEAISNIDFAVKPAEFVSIVGPSGCGKSTLLSVIAGLLPPTAGKVYVNGELVTKTSPMVGYMLQKDHLFSWRTIWQNVTLGLEVQKCKTKENTDYVKDLLRTYGLYEFKDKYPAQLSGGMRQRAALIRTLATRPEILLLDEAFSALDYQTRLSVCDDIYEIIKREDKTAILVTHDLSEAISVADQILVLSRRPGRIQREVPIHFEMEKRTPMRARSAPEFQEYFNLIWKELNTNG